MHTLTLEVMHQHLADTHFTCGWIWITRRYLKPVLIHRHPDCSGYTSPPDFSSLLFFFLNFILSLFNQAGCLKLNDIFFTSKAWPKWQHQKTDIKQKESTNMKTVKMSEDNKVSFQRREETQTFEKAHIKL